MPTNWDEIASQAGEATDDHFKNQISSLTRLNDLEIENLITETGISKQDLAKVLAEVKDTAKSNEDKAQAIQHVSKGMHVLIGLASKLI